MNQLGKRRLAGACRAAAVLTILSLSIGVSFANPVFDKADDNFSGRVMPGGVVVPGSEVTLRGAAFKPGQEVTLLRGQTVLNAQPFVADAEGNFEGKIEIPANAVPGHHPIVLDVVKPTAASVIELKVSPDVPLSGEKNYTLTSEKVANGMFQVVYSAKSDRLFVTSATGRPPVTESLLQKINPKDLSVEASVTPPKVQGRDDGGVYAVYGLAVDDTNGTVWTTNTRQNTVSVYKQSDLSLIKTFDAGSVPHAFHMAVDGKRNHAYASTGTQNLVIAFDAKKAELKGPIEIESSVRPAGRGPAPTFAARGLHLDEATGKLYVVSGSTNEVAIINTANNEVESVFQVPGMRSGFGAAVNSKGKRLFVTDQGADSLFIIDLAKNELLHQVPVGAGALGVTFDPVSNNVYVANRGAGTITVVSQDGKIIANLDGGTFPNHIIAAPKGVIYATNKARGAEDPKGDRLTRLTISK